MLDQAQTTDDVDSAPTGRTADTNTGDGQDPPAGSREDTVGPRSIGKDDAFHLLQNARRRAVLRYLLAHPGQTEFRMRDLAEEVAAWEHDTTVKQLMSDQRQRVYIALYQSHLPKLDDYGVIDYNQPRGIVEPTPLIEALAPFLEDGLHADDQHLSIEDATARPTTGNGHQPRLVPTLSSLFAR